MNERTKLAKAYLKGIANKSDFMNLLDSLVLTEDEMTVLKSIYLEGKQLSIIADDLGFSVQTIKRLHKNSLFVVSNFIYDSTRN